MSEPFDRLATALADRYRLVGELGQGGMATVYLAEDLKHGRRVAIKVLRPELAAIIGAERFLSEIRTTANLHHPHILPLHDSGSVENLLFYVMPFVEGVSLRERLAEGTPLPIEDASRIAAQVAGALDYAHRRGVIHRDIKPENILLQEDQALVADFGIALTTDPGVSARLTETGLSVGTPQYMSPEQALGERALDARSDIYAAGVTLYEALTGTPPFTGPSAQAIVAKVLMEDSVPPSRHRPEIPPELDAAVLTAIDKDPDGRFQTAAALAQALATPTPPRGSVTSMTPARAVIPSAVTKRVESGRRPPTRWMMRALVTVAIAVVAVIGYALLRGNPSGSPDAGGARSIAAIPFENFSQEAATSAYLADGIPEEILGDLARLPTLAVRPMAQDNRFRNHPNLTAVATELRADIILTGSVVAVGDSVRLTVRPYDVRRNVYLASVAVTAGSGNIFGLEDSMSRALVARLALPASAAHALPAAPLDRPIDPAAHDSLLLAKWYVAKRDCASLDRAIDLLTKATRLDSSYARAWANLAQVHNLRAAFFCARGIDEFVPARAAVQRALRLDRDDAFAHMTLGFLHVIADWDWPGASDEFVRAVALAPNEADIWLFRTWYFTATGQLDSARATIRRAASLDPSSSIIRTRVGTVLYYSDSLDAAIAEFTSILSREPGFPPAAVGLAQAYADAHKCDAARTQLRVHDVAHAGPGDVVYAMGRCGEAAAARDSVRAWEVRAARGEFVPSFQVAVAYAGLRDDVKTLAWLGRAVADRDWQVWELGAYPPFRHLHGQAAFRALLERVRYPSAQDRPM